MIREEKIAWLVGSFMHINPYGLFNAKSYLYIDVICKPIDCVQLFLTSS